MMSLQPTSLRRQALGVMMPGFSGLTLPDWVATLLRDGLRGVCLFGHNIESPAQLASLTTAIYRANPHAIIAIDEEGGDVSRLHQHNGSPFPGNAVLGRIDDMDATRSTAAEVGAQLADVGIHLTLAPVADINSDPHNPVIGVRSFGANAAAVAAQTAAWVEGVQSVGVAACAKHFPGHGDTSTDSHLVEPVVTADAATLASREFLPFRAAIAAGVRAIMTAHVRVPALDPDVISTFSATTLGELLRNDMGFNGVIVTDALDMAGASATRGIPNAAVAAVAAGADLLCLGSNNSPAEIAAVSSALADAVDAGTIPRHRLTDAEARCVDLGAWVAGQRRRYRATAPIPAPRVGRDQVAASFTLSDHAAAVLASAARKVRWVRIDPEPNQAIGDAPFGPFFAGGAVASFLVPTHDRTRADAYVAEPGAITVVVGRDFHRDRAASAAAATIAAQGDAVVVDMGYAVGEGVDIATFGASRLVGEALIELVEAHT